MVSSKKDIEKAKKENKLLLGTNIVFKKLKVGELKTIVYSSNCPEETKKDLEYYHKLNNIEIQEFEGTSKQLGEVCGKPFNTLIIGIKK